MTSTTEEDNSILDIWQRHQVTTVVGLSRESILRSTRFIRGDYRKIHVNNYNVRLGSGQRVEMILEAFTCSYQDRKAHILLAIKTSPHQFSKRV